MPTLNVPQRGGQSASEAASGSRTALRQAPHVRRHNARWAAPRLLVAMGLAAALPALGCDADSAATGDWDEVTVPGGAFAMGCNDALDTDCDPDEWPQHTVTVPGFAIDRTETTVTRYAAFLNAHGNTCGGEPCVNDWGGIKPLPVVEAAGQWAAREGFSARPMTGVTWFGADAYCAWDGRALCTEAQWEKAARGGCETQSGPCLTTTRTAPWGEDQADCTLTVMHGPSGPGCNTDRPMDVGSKPAGASVYGAVDLVGNVWEWVADGYHNSFQGAPTDGSAWAGSGPDLRVVRGGGGLGVSHEQRAGRRGGAGPKDVTEWRGFRCCRSL